MIRTTFTSPPDGDIITNPTKGILRALILYVNEDYWCSGSGDSNLTYSEDSKNSNLDLVFNKNHGFYLHYQSQGADYYTKGHGNYLDTTNNYIGGNLVILPTFFFVSPIKTFEIVDYFLETGQIKNLQNDWIESKLSKWDWEKYMM